jgi:trigger factor
MNIEVEQLSRTDRRITVQIPWENVKGELDAAYQGLQKRARLKGFRPGKVPRKVLEQYYRSTVEGEVVGRLVEEAFRQAVDEHDLFPIDQPNLEATPSVKAGEPLEFVATVAVKPEVDPEKYEGLEVERKIREVSDEEVEAELLTLREKATVVEQVEDRRHAEQGDLAVIDFFGYIDGETFKGGKGINYTVEIGGGTMIPGFEEALIGLEIGGEKTFTLPFPEDDGPEEARGKDVEWRVELKELKRKILPELDDELAKDLGDYDTLDELRAGIRENLATREDAKSKRLLRNQVVDALIEANDVEVPDKMVERQIEYMLRDTLRFVQQDNLDPKLQEAIDRIRVEARPTAEKQVKTMLLLEGVARKEGVEVTESELDGRIQELSREHKIPVAQLRQQLRQNDQLEGIRYNLLQDKALDLVVQRASITEKTVTAEELEAAMNPDEGEAAPDEG